MSSEIPTPKLELSKAYQDPATPYTCEVDLVRLGSLLAENNVSQARIDSLVIKLERRSRLRFMEFYARYDLPDHRIVLFLDSFWKAQDKNRGQTGQFTSDFRLIHEVKHVIDHDKQALKYTGFAVSVLGGIGGATTPYLLQYLLTEVTGRAYPDPAGWQVAGFVACGIALANLLQPREILANRFGEQMASMPKWEKLITLSPKNPE